MKFYLDAYWDLASDRPESFGSKVRQIPWTAIDRYAERYQIRGLAYETFHAVMRMFDKEVIGGKSG